jgi:hypothetical protein
MVLTFPEPSLFYLFFLPNFLCLRFFLQLSMTKRTSPTLLNEDFFHHLNQFTIVQDLLNDMGVRLSVVFAVWKTTLPTHLFTPLKLFIQLLHSFSKRTEPLDSGSPIHLFQGFRPPENLFGEQVYGPSAKRRNPPNPSSIYL